MTAANTKCLKVAEQLNIKSRIELKTQKYKKNPEKAREQSWHRARRAPWAKLLGLFEVNWQVCRGPDLCRERRKRSVCFSPRAASLEVTRQLSAHSVSRTVGHFLSSHPTS